MYTTLPNGSIHNRNLNSSNSLAHLLANEFFFEDEPLLIHESGYYDNYFSSNSNEIKYSGIFFYNLNCCSFSPYKFDQLLPF